MAASMTALLSTSKLQCPGGCMREFTFETLRRNGGVCGICSKKSAQYEFCSECGTRHYKKVLQKDGCWICKHKQTHAICEQELALVTAQRNQYKEERDTFMAIIQLMVKANTQKAQTPAPANAEITHLEQPKAQCPRCKAEFTQRTLDKYNGKCGRCFAMHSTICRCILCSDQ